MRTKFFRAVRKGNAVGDGTAGALIDWLEQYINLLFPDNGIEYWADNERGYGSGLRRCQPVPAAGHEDGQIHHVACYVRDGSCEGTIIHAAFVLQADKLSELAWIKSFGSEEECYQIAKAIRHALDSILIWQEIPEIVDMAIKVPKKYRWERKAMGNVGKVTIARDQYSIKVLGENGVVYEDRSWKECGQNAVFAVDAFVADWEIVFKSMGVMFSVDDLRFAVPA